ncbi:MAG: ribonuclease HII [Candidatus Doudnabacteria bacterium RIFCSPLOWO2_02_FULL_42_9]|uniref:Ribonuclease HII n=1 Tax=Candidatus Doudnabacteria bacterium RIFCSPHIGHO2_01_FULL_41_86 TaxID=1817821 RepID=A0A1F5N969_9BACT|nr:MAG: ribonuclease HII [Candidatus Doudnabacteria bacterium RIFCSPHIGHO2_01_FULL_41_86]OGE75169.1 MAG: ribonuclease HII [Candidatus Doudnabacteria bacterium RIFCSPHIGHO2_01_43_10]OGE86406.1 MAG: ribonuclease HII [Candidatus Doudnabacteria bacterium RIFCSPHIGHO2_12_FULL_42_22]OGE87405.1 MAG: ribonuclease HII [Candidatus Doudnabacteria bacterium RIFCSPHIGHO2_02_FULL_42_25]OGE92703.1 MAG: ribonuclease HII [Candidatus Doudnabacteria bacterium RIFCSPLOWO2_01_FULL_42_60]OGE93623.1 MAG: ribonucleas
MKFPTYKYETKKMDEGFRVVAGCDEVGIAPIAGPVVAATVILDATSIGKQRSKSKWWYRVRDSKTVDEKERNELVSFIKDHCIDFGVGVVSHETIDEINIYQASLLAMEKSVSELNTVPDFLFLDGIHKLTKLSIVQQPVISGDAKILSISAASLVAKVARDKILHEMHEIFPEYGFDKHKGYGTQFHKTALMKHGVTPMHRQTFGFVALCLKRMKSMNNFKKIFLAPEPSRT